MISSAMIVSKVFDTKTVIKIICLTIVFRDFVVLKDLSFVNIQNWKSYQNVFGEACFY